MVESEPSIGQIVAPGDPIFELPDAGVVRIGSGLYENQGKLLSTKPGVLSQAKNGKLWIASRQKRYIPSSGDSVLGIIKSKHSDYYEVDIGAPFTALLPVLAFEGATRRNRPNLGDGDLVYCRVDASDRDIQPTLSCTDPAGRSAGFGPLSDGFHCTITTSHARALLSQPPPLVLTELARSLQFELAVGMNGRVWVSSQSPDVCITVCRALQTTEGMNENQVKAVVHTLVKP